MKLSKNVLKNCERSKNLGAEGRNMNEILNMNKNDLNITYQKEEIKKQAAIEKEFQMNEIKDAYAQRREVRHEFQRAARKAQYDEITILRSGELRVDTRNSWANIPGRPVANFKFLGNFPLVSSDGDDGLTVFLLEIAGAEKNFYLNNARVGIGDYLLKKITSGGGVIFANSRNAQIELLRKIWISVHPIHTDPVLIPTHFGWVEFGKNEFKFVKRGTRLWKEYVEMAK